MPRISQSIRGQKPTAWPGPLVVREGGSTTACVDGLGLDQRWARRDGMMVACRRFDSADGAHQISRRVTRASRRSCAGHVSMREPSRVSADAVPADPLT